MKIIFFLEYAIADGLRRLDTNIMNIEQCAKAHKYSGFPVRKNKNICAGGEKGNSLNKIIFKYLLNIII